MKLIFVTSNENKVREVGHILGVKLNVHSVEIPEIQSLSTQENARHKAYEAYRLIGKPVIVEDTGLYIKGFDGFPGALAKWYVKGVGYEGVCRAVDACKTRDVYAETCIAFYNGKLMKVFSGRAYGAISDHEQGVSGFGWDRIFIPKGKKTTFAKMTIDQKLKISHRGRCVKKLKSFLQKNRML